MKKLILGVMLLVSTTVFGQYYDRNYDKVGEWRKDIYGNWGWYEKKQQQVPKSNIDWMKIITEQRLIIANQNVQNAYQINFLADEAYRRAIESQHRHDYETSKVEFYNAYLYMDRLVSMPNVSGLENGYMKRGIAYSNYLMVVLLNMGNNAEFVRMYDYNIIKYSMMNGIESVRIVNDLKKIYKILTEK